MGQFHENAISAAKAYLTPPPHHTSPHPQKYISHVIVNPASICP